MAACVRVMVHYSHAQHAEPSGHDRPPVPHTRAVTLRRGGRARYPRCSRPGAGGEGGVGVQRFACRGRPSFCCVSYTERGGET